jgi:hypothetical protein
VVVCERVWILGQLCELRVCALTIQFVQTYISVCYRSFTQQDMPSRREMRTPCAHCLLKTRVNNMKKDITSGSMPKRRIDAVSLPFIP